MKPFIAKIIYRFGRKKAIDRALKALTKPGVKPMRDFEQEVVHSARRTTHRFKHFQIAEYTWGHGPRRALLVHGWEGRAANFAALIPILVDAGFTVRGFDAPAHGESTRAETSLFDFGDLVTHYLSEHRYELLLSHSFGSVPLSYALHQWGNYPVNRLMLITTPNRLFDRVAQMVDRLRFPEALIDDVFNAFQTQFNIDGRELSVSRYLSTIRPVRATVVYSKTDKALPPEWSEEVAAALVNCTGIGLDDTGHYRILWDQRTQQLLHELVTT
jgi:pimeloyl-ACP methyl ester carboxylesterase